MSGVFADFTLELGPGAAVTGAGTTTRTHLVTAVSSVGGRAQGSLTFSPDEALGLALIQVAGSDPDLPLRKQVGGDLFERVFSGAVRDLWVQVKQQAQNEGAGLRLRLAIDDAALAALPWELLRDGGEFLATRADTPVSRFLPVPAAPYLAPQQSLNILLVIQDPGGALAITPAEVDALKSALAELAPEVTCTSLLNPSIAEIQIELQQGYQVFHYLGHGDATRLFFVGPKKLMPIDDEAFAQLFSGRRTLRLVVLTACSSAQSEGGLFSGIGPALVAKRMPAVVGMQYKFVQLATAGQFSKALYRAIANGLAVDAAVNEARQLLSAGPLLATRDWSTPVLYMSTPVGRILDIGSGADALTGSWNDLKDRAGTSVRGAAALNEVAQLLAGLATLQNEVLVLELKAGFDLLSRLRDVEGAFQPCRALVAKAGSASGLLPLFPQLKDAWTAVDARAWPALDAYVSANPEHRFRSLVAGLPAAAAAIRGALNRVAMNDLFAACTAFDRQLTAAEVGVEQKVDAAIQTLITASAQTLGKIS
jgi:hypothetical protein